MLLQQSRFDLAEAELRLALAEDPDNGRLHSFLAICLTERDRLDEAQAAADRGIGLAPDEPAAHYIRAQVLRKRKELEGALGAVEESLRLGPAQPPAWALRGAIHLDRRSWPAALEAAESGLSFDAGDADCANVRAIALTQLGRREEAAASLGAALERDPENDVTHANRGWGLLHEGDPRKAMEHFREALRLDPTNEWARAGIVEALKARNPIYGLMLKYFLWMGRLSSKAQLGIVVGGFIGYQVLAEQSARHPAARPFLLPILIAYGLFALFSWIASPLFNALLRFHPLGRHALSDDQRRAGTWVGLFFLAALAALIWWPLGGGLPARGLAIYLGLFLIPLSGTFACAPGRYRNFMGLVTAALFVMFATPFAAYFGGWEPGRGVERAIVALADAYPLGVLAASLLAGPLAVASRR